MAWCAGAAFFGRSLIQEPRPSPFPPCDFGHVGLWLGRRELCRMGNARYSPVIALFVFLTLLVGFGCVGGFLPDAWPERIS